MALNRGGERGDHELRRDRERERGKGQRRNGRGEVEKGGRETRVEGCMERGDKGMEKELATPLGR